MIGGWPTDDEMNMKRLGIAAVIGLITTLIYAGDIGVVTNYFISLQFKDGTIGGVAIPWIGDRRDADYCKKPAVGLQIGATNDVWFITTDVMPIIATNRSGRSYVLPKK
jgi:hypothetical protein